MAKAPGEEFAFPLVAKGAMNGAHGDFGLGWEDDDKCNY
jgi:hypothetical protein